jgi:hypothetical protein
MATTQSYTTADERVLQNLILLYYRAIAAEEAYRDFVADSPDGLYEGDAELMQQVADGTKALVFESVPGITTLQQVKAALNQSNFRSNRGIFRKAGLITGADPEHYGEQFNAVTLEDKRSFFKKIMILGEGQERSSKDDLRYETAVPGGTHFGAAINHVNKPEIAYQHYNESYMMAPNNVQYLLAKFPEDSAQNMPIKLALTLLGQYQAYQTEVLAKVPQPPNARYDMTQPYNLQTARNTLLQRVITAVSAKPTPWTGTNEQETKYNIKAILDRGERWVLSEPEGASHTDYLTTHITHFAPRLDGLTSYEEKQALGPQTVRTDARRKFLEARIAATGAYIIGLVDKTDDPNTARISLLYDNLIKEVGDLLGFPYNTYREEYVKDEVDAIKEFFNIDTGNDTELTDAPALATATDLIREEQAGTTARKGIAAAARRLTALDMQCYLLENIRSITGQRQWEQRYFPDYKHVTQVGGQGGAGAPAAAADPALVLNAIRTGHIGTKSMEVLLNLCPDVYALLQPYIKIYRVDYYEDGTVKGDPLELEIPNFISPDDIYNLTRKQRGRAAGSGLRSFSWKLEGVQPAEVDNNITATMEIYFQSVNDFFNGASQAGEPGAPNFLDLIINSPAVKKDKKDADRRSSKCAQSQRYRDYQGENFRIKVIAGWATPDINSLKHALSSVSSTTGSEISAEDLKNAIQSTQVALYLQQVRHNLNFQEDGSVILSVDYQASLAGLLTGPNADILSSSPKGVADRLKALKEETARLREISSPTDADKRLVEEYAKERKEIIQEDRLLKYRKFLQGLLSPDCATASKIYSLPVDLNELLLEPYSSLTPEQRAARAKRRSDPSFSAAITTADAVNLTLLSAFTDAQKAEGGKTVAEEFTESERTRMRDIQTKKEQFKFIPFMFLGDLIDNVVEQIKQNNDGTPLNFRTLLAETEVIDPLGAMQIMNLDCLNEDDLRDDGFIEKLKKSDVMAFQHDNGVQIKINLGDIPISLDAFQVWFKNNVIKKDRDKYYLLYFIKSLCSELITKAFNSDCFGPDYRFNQRYDAQPLTLKSSPPLPPRISAFGLGQRMPSPIGHASNALPALIVLPTDSRPSNLKGNYKDDKKVGIYHHYIGAACGPLKTLAFNREDQEFLRETKLQKEGALGPEQLRELYSCNLELIGNNLYQNGAYIYINPTLLDANKEDLDYLGLHGYYLVTSVASKITPEGFDTSLTALHEGIYFEHNPAASPQIFAGAAEFNGGPPPNFATLSTDYWRIREQTAEVEAAAAAGSLRSKLQLEVEKAARGEGLLPGIFTVPGDALQGGIESVTSTAREAKSELDELLEWAEGEDP